MPIKKIDLGQLPDGTFRPLQLDISGNLKTTGGGGGGGSTVEITDGVDNATITDVGGKKSLDVNVTDITLSHTNDSVQIGNGTNLVDVNSDGSLSTRDIALATRVDEPTSTTTYVGKAVAGSSNGSSVWQISRLTTSGSVTTVEYADGNTNFDNIWNNRASLTYS